MKKSNIQIFLALSLISLLPACSEQHVNNKKVLTETPPAAKSTETTPIKIEPTESNKSNIDMKKCICIQLWMPVCGENGKTYSNSCFAKCAGVKFKQGSCAKTITD